MADLDLAEPLIRFVEAGEKGVILLPLLLLLLLH
jgi:hypothetical protein